MSVTLPAINALSRIVKLIELVPPSERPWLFMNLRQFIAGSNGGAPPSAKRVQNPVQNHGSEPGSEPSLNKDVVSSFFLQFWTAYPRKVGKQEALRIYRKLEVNQELQERILKAVHEQKASEQWTKDKGQFIPLPKTWLNRGSWDDEPMRMNRAMNLNPNPNHFSGCECRQCAAS